MERIPGSLRAMKRYKTRARLIHLSQVDKERVKKQIERLKTFDRDWTSQDATAVSHALSAGLTAQLLGAVGLSLAADAAYATGDEEIALTVTLQFEADLL